jgi:hypothetical protein
VNLNDPLIRIVVWTVVIAVATRLVFELVMPVLPYLVALVVLYATARFFAWYRGRW